MRTTAVHYRIVAEMETTPGVPPGVMRWLGLDPYPHWTDEAHAIAFASPQSLAQFLDAGNGFARGLYRPKAGSMKIVKQTIRTSVTVRTRRFRAGRKRA